MPKKIIRPELEFGESIIHNCTTRWNARVPSWNPGIPGSRVFYNGYIYQCVGRHHVIGGDPPDKNPFWVQVKPDARVKNRGEVRVREFEKAEPYREHMHRDKEILPHLTEIEKESLRRMFAKKLDESYTEAVLTGTSIIKVT